MSPRRAGPAALLLLAAAWLAAPAPLRAELGKPAMAVKFELAEENYRQALDDAQEAEIENAVEAGLVEALGARIGFIDFSNVDHPKRRPFPFQRGACLNCCWRPASASGFPAG